MKSGGLPKVPVLRTPAHASLTPWLVSPELQAGESGRLMCDFPSNGWLCRAGTCQVWWPQTPGLGRKQQGEQDPHDLPSSRAKMRVGVGVWRNPPPTFLRNKNKLKNREGKETTDSRRGLPKRWEELSIKIWSLSILLVWLLPHI